VFEDLITKPLWKKTGKRVWCYNGDTGIVLKKLSGIIYHLKYFDEKQKTKSIIAQSEDIAKDKAEDFLEEMGII